MTKHNYFPVILFILCIVAGIACTQQRQPCLTPKIATLALESIHFKTDTATIPVDTPLASAVFIPVTGATALMKLYPKQSTFTVSLSPDTVFCRWAFTTDTVNYKAGNMDTVDFYYRRHLQFLSNACGFTYFYDLDSVKSTHQIIDSIHILNASVTNNVNTNHLQVYIHRNF